MKNKDDISDIKSMYESEVEDDRLIRHRLEYDLTWRYLEEYLPPRGKILELGAASGRYTLKLAQCGYSITAFDLSETLTDLSRLRLDKAGLGDRVTHLVGDARDLSILRGKAFDAAVVMGPLYHLVYESDRRLVLQQVYDLLKPGGLIFTAFISRLGIFGDLMKKIPEWIEKRSEVRSIIEHGLDPEDRPHQGFRGYFATIGEIAPLHESEGFETILVTGVEPAISADDDSYNSLNGSRRQAWLDLLYEISSEPTIVGASRHVLYIGHRP